jgi:hypothetical protein
MSKKSGSGMNNPYHISDRLETIFGLKYLNSLMRIRDPRWKIFGSGMEKIWIRDTHLGSATLLFGINTNTFMYLMGSSETRGQLFHSREQNSPQAVTRNMIRLCLKGHCHKMDIF